MFKGVYHPFAGFGLTFHDDWMSPRIFDNSSRQLKPRANSKRRSVLAESSENHSRIIAGTLTVAQVSARVAPHMRTT